MTMFTLGYCWWSLILVLLVHLIQETSSLSPPDARDRLNREESRPGDPREPVEYPIFRQFGNWENQFQHGREFTPETEAPSVDSREGGTSGFVNEKVWTRDGGQRFEEEKYEKDYPPKFNEPKPEREIVWTRDGGQRFEEEKYEKDYPPKSHEPKPEKNNFGSDEKDNHEINPQFGHHGGQNNQYRQPDFGGEGNPQFGDHDRENNQERQPTSGDDGKEKYFKSNSLLGVILAGFKGSLLPFFATRDGDIAKRTKDTNGQKTDFTDRDIRHDKRDDIETKEIDFQGFLFGALDQSTTKPAALCTDAPATVLNKSVDCFHESLNKINLSDDQLFQVLSDQGGSYVKDYMATSAEMANNNFRNLISLTDDYPDSNFKRHPTDWLWNYDMTKAKLLEQLEISHLQLIHVKPDDLPINGYVENHWQHWMNSTKRRDEIIADRLRHYLTPAKYMSKNVSRHTMADDGTSSTMEYCQTRGAESADGYLHMCTTCAHTTTLADDKFPRVLNEAVCHSTDSGCLFVGDTPHGSCRQNVFYMNMLRKKAGKCMMVIHDGTTVLTDEWELYSQPIRVSCECLVNKRSPVAKNVNPN